MPKDNKRKSYQHTKKSISPLWYIFGGLIFVVAAVIAMSVLNSSGSGSASAYSGSLMGTEVPVSSRAHVAENTIPGPYASNPPAGGSHFAVDYTEKFYQESDVAALPPHPEGYLVHSLEHGYVIFWYNCQAFAEIDCSSLKQTIQLVMNQAGNTKLIAFPWSSMDVPLAMTSWGRILKMTQPDPQTMLQFVLHNRYKAPEPDAP